jgi:hypothetical protein
MGEMIRPPYDNEQTEEMPVPLLRRRLRGWEEVSDNPQTPYMVGRLLGANQMAIALLSHEQNETAQLVSSVLAEVTAFFMEDVPESKGK